MHRRATRNTLALLLPLAAGAAAGPASAAEEQGPRPLPCTRPDHLAGFLEQAYGERPVAAGLQSNGQLLQVFAASGADGGSWTAVATSPAGTACVVATGRHWEQATAGGGEPAVAAEGGAARVPAAARP